MNHLPEAFEYQFEPDLLGHVEDGAYTYRVVGASCLAGDEFGVYDFAAPLAVGDPVVFNNVGAYSLVKANLFNGINLPQIYARTEAGHLSLRKRFDYAHFLAHCGADDDAHL
jgi:carboxynorspermidine decarboxylase